VRLIAGAIINITTAHQGATISMEMVWFDTSLSDYKLVITNVGLTEPSSVR